MSTGTITRQQLREAIQAGITNAEGQRDFTPDIATKLLRVADETERVARGSYQQVMPGGLVVGCPVAQAFPDFARLTWDRAFTSGYDGATLDREAVLRVTDEPQEGSGA